MNNIMGVGLQFGYLMCGVFNMSNKITISNIFTKQLFTPILSNKNDVCSDNQSILNPLALES